ncbi:MAG: hypothetical protein JSV21_04170, partial [Nitrospirota bacterium]
KRIMHRRRTEVPQYYKVCVPNKYARDQRVTLGYGSHHVKKKKLWKNIDCPIVDSDDLKLAHFPVRSIDQLFCKGIAGWLSSVGRTDVRSNENWHFKKFYERFSRGEKFGLNELAREALGYGSKLKIDEIMELIVKEPLVSEGGGIDILYTKGYECDPLSILAVIGEEFAVAYGKYRREHLSFPIKYFRKNRSK